MKIRITKPGDWDAWQFWVIDWIIQKNYKRFVLLGIHIEW
jgi:hypothetical protein